MNKYFIIISCFLVSFLWSCDTLEIENLSDYDANSVWNDEKLATAYVTNLYATVFTNWDSAADQNSEQVSGIPFYIGTITISGSSYKKWNYTTIRRINAAIQDISQGDLPDNIKQLLTAQVLFMRAYVYFDMVVYHGGVPYIKVPQNKETDDLLVQRNTTAECYGFIVKDLEDAILGLPDKISSSSGDYGRIDKVYAKAFKAKVLLYKASPQFNPSHPYTNAYWADAYSAAKDAYDFAKEQGSALTPNYSDIFVKEGGAEVLFAVINEYPNKTATWDWHLRPQSLSTGQIQRTPTWDMVKAFPMADGKQFDDATGKYYVSSETDLMQSFWKNRDPRFYSSILCSGQELPVAGMAAGYRQYTALGLADDADAYGTNPNSGGATTTKNDVMSGFYVRKALDLSLTPEITDQYSLDCIKMRFAELMMIYAEAANEAGHSDVTIEILKEIRKRAGIEAGDGNYGLPASPAREELRQIILDERNIEFCFEGHRFWDLRRTRNMMILSGLQKYGLESIAIDRATGLDMPINTAKEKAKNFELTPDDFRYVKQRVPYNPNAENTFVVEETFYFFPLQKTVLDENPNLEQNSNWGGTFNPALE
ncbi:membrane protein [Bacteroidia bacterium]|nr:membrane protein [Bacteroidia bacterium]